VRRLSSSLLFAVLICVSFSQKINKFSNDLEWDGESKRIIAVGDGKEKSDVSYEIASEFR
jgi:hypothetical protein